MSQGEHYNTRRQFVGRTRRQFVGRSAALGAAAFIPGVLAACGGDDDDDGQQASASKPSDTRVAGTITVATMPGPRWEGALRSSAEAYKDANPKATVNVAVNPFAEHYQKIGTELASDSDATDLYVFDAALLGQSQSKLLDLSDLYESDPEWKDFYLNGVPDVYRGSWDWEGKPLSVVHDANCMMSWWRTDIFEDEGLQPPETFEQMLENANALNQVKANSGFMTTAMAGAYLAVLYTGMMAAFGGKWWENDEPDRFGRISPDDPPGAVLLDSEENIAAMTMLRDLVAAGPKSSLNAQEFENNEAFKNGVVYQQLMWSGLMTLQTKKENPEYHNVLESGPFPVGGSHSDTNATGIKGGFGLSIPKASKNAELAFDFAKFVTSRENAETFIAGGGQPANAELLKEWSSKPGFQVFGTLADGIIAGHHQAQFPEGGEFYDIISNATASVLTGEKDPAQGCADMKSQTETMLQRAGYV